MRKLLLVGIVAFWALMAGSGAAWAYRVLPPAVPMQAYPAPQDSPRLAKKSTFQLQQRRQASRTTLERQVQPSALRAPRFVPRSPVQRPSAFRSAR